MKILSALRLSRFLCILVTFVVAVLATPQVWAQYSYGKLTSLSAAPSTGLVAGQTLSVGYTLVSGTEPVTKLTVVFTSADGKYSQNLSTTTPSSTGTLTATVGADWPNAVYQLSGISITDSLNDTAQYLPTGKLGTGNNLSHPWLYPVGGSAPDLSGSSFTVTGGASSVQAPVLTAFAVSNSAPITAGQPIVIAYSITGGTAPNWNLAVTLSAPDGAIMPTLFLPGSGSVNTTLSIPTTASWVNGTYKLLNVGLNDADSSQNFSRGSAQVPTTTDFALTGGTATATYPQLTSLSLVGPSTTTLGQTVELNCAIVADTSPISSVLVSYLGPDESNANRTNVFLSSTTGGILSFPVRADSINGVYKLISISITDSTGHNVSYYPNGQIIGSPVYSGGTEPSPFSGDFTVAGALSQPPAIAVEPVGGTVQPGQTLTLAVGFVGPPVSVQWYQGQTGDTSQPATAGTSAGFSPQPLSSTTTFWARGTNASGSVDSAAATITIAYTSALPVISLQPQPIDALVNNGQSLFIYASGPGPLSYQWYQDGVAVPGAIATQLFLSGTEAQSGTYTVIITNPNGSVTSTPVSVVFYGQPQILTQPVSQTAAYGSTVTFTVQATGGELGYAWFGPNGNYSNNSPTLTLTNVQQTFAGAYFVEINNRAGSARSSSATLTVTGGPVPVLTVASTAYGTVGQYFGLQVNAANSPLTFSANGLPPGLTINQNGVINGTPTSSGTFPVTITATNAGGTTSATVSITITSGPYAPVFTQQPQSQTAVLHTTVTLTAAASGTPINSTYGLVYQWYFNGQAITNATYSSYTITVGADASTAGNYTVNAFGSVGTTTSAVAQLTVDTAHSAPYLTSANTQLSVLAGNTATITVGAGGTGPLTYAWKGYNGSPVLNSPNAASLSLPNAAVDDEGNYTVVISNAYGQIEAGEFDLAVNYVPQPATQTIAPGQTATLAVPTSAEVTTYQWYQGAVLDRSHPLAGATSAVFTTPPLTATTSYWVQVQGHIFGDTSSGAVVIVGTTGTTGPQFTAQPQSGSVAAGGSYSFTTTAPGAASYQWYFNGAAISGATGPVYTVTAAGLANSGSYYVLVSNGSGTAVSSTAMLSVASASAPVVAQQPASQVSNAGSTVVFSVSVGGAVTTSADSLHSLTPQAQGAVTYQWYLNGTPLAGATSADFVTTASTATAGSYICLISNGLGTIASNAVTLALAPTGADPGRLINLSVLAFDAPGSRLLTVGFVSGGATAGNQNVLMRVSGPALTAFSVANLLPDPVLTLLSGTTSVATNDHWAANQAAITATDFAVGAFALADPASFDAALVMPLPAAGPYTIQVTSRSAASGNVLAEVYDATAAGTYTTATPRLINLSCLDYLDAGGILTAGFTIGGTTSKTVLIRAAGPALAAAPFALAAAIPDPTLTVFHQQSSMAANSSWKGDLAIATAARAVLAFAWNDPSSHDAAVITTLSPGTYTVQATSAGGTAGQVLVEVYEVP